MAPGERAEPDGRSLGDRAEPCPLGERSLVSLGERAGHGGSLCAQLCVPRALGSHRFPCPSPLHQAAAPGCGTRSAAPAHQAALS